MQRYPKESFLLVEVLIFVLILVGIVAMIYRRPQHVAPTLPTPTTSSAPID